MAKKQKENKPKQVPTKRQLSKWQRQARIRHIIIIAVAIFLAGILGYVGYGYYNSEIKPSHEIVIEVNDVSFNMGYYMKMLDAQTKNMEPSYVYYWTDTIARYIEDAELMRQEAKALDIVASREEIDTAIEEKEYPNDKLYRDIVETEILYQKLSGYFDSALPDTMEQAHVQVMLVESQEMADAVMAEIESIGNFTALVDEFSCNPQIEGDLGWLPQELMPRASIGEVAFSLEPGETSKIYDQSVIKNVGYWLIEVTDKNEEGGIKARAMLLGSEQEALEIKSKLDKGEDFAVLAKEYSQHGSKDDGGELGWLEQGDMNSEAFDEIAFNLPLNSVSEPVKDESAQTEGGCWIAKVLQKGEHELSEEIKERLTSNDFAQWLQEQRENNTINNYLDEEKRAWAVDRVLKRR
ncbi:MAG: peptidylprolyl isomerase [Dehalococcoidia bacterium]